MSDLTDAQGDEEQAQPAPAVVPERIAYTVAEFARLVGCHRNTIYGQVKTGKIPAVYIGTKPLIPRRWVEETFGMPTDV